MSEQTEIPPERGERRLPPLPTRVVQVFVSPIRLFERLRDEPAAWGALLLGAVITGASSAVIPLEVWEGMIRNQLLQAGQAAPADISMPATFARVAGSIGPLIFFPIMGALAAGLFSLVFLFGLGYEGRFRQYFSVVAHALLVVAVAGVAMTPFRILTGNLQFTVALGGLFSFLGDSLAGRFLNLVDLFSVWACALIGVGAATIDGAKRPGPSAGVSIGVLLLILLLVASLLGVGGRPA